MQGELLKELFTVGILSYTGATQGPAMVGSGGKFSNSRPLDARKMIFGSIF